MRLGERLALTVINEYLDMMLVDKTETLSQPEEVRRFNQAMNSLSYPEQTLVRLRYEQGLSLNELASRLGLSPSAVKMRLKRSRDKMQRCYARQLAG